MAYYSHESLNNMIQEVEKEFPLENLFFRQTTFGSSLKIRIILMMKQQNVPNHF